MKLEYLGHACFLLESDSGVRIVFDPYTSGCFGNSLRYGPVGVDADMVLASHDHEDHWDPKAVGGKPRVFQTSGFFTHRGMKISGIDTDHDPSGGSQRGANVVFRVDGEGVSVVHLGDLGHVLTEEQADRIGVADVLLVPVGGHFTIDDEEALTVSEMLLPKVTIPMHFKTSKVDFPIAKPDAFLSAAPGVKRVGASRVEFTAETLPAGPETWLLDPAR